MSCPQDNYWSKQNGSLGPAISICYVHKIKKILCFGGVPYISDMRHVLFFFSAVKHDFVRRVGQKYFVSNKERGSFSQAIEFCSQQDLELALPRNEEENSALTQLFGEVDKMVWIYVNNKKAEGHFETDMKNRRLTFTKWGEGQPNGSVGDTGCTMLSENGVWRVSQDCSLNAYIICQI